MGYILDLIVVAIIVIAILISRKRGFVRTAVELVGFVLAVYLAFSVGPMLSETTYDKAVKPAVTETIESTLNDTINTTTENISNAVWDAMPSFVSKNADKFGVSENSLSENFNLTSEESIAKTAENISAKVVAPVVVKALSIVYGLIIFIIVAVLAKILAKPINKLFSISFIGSINKLLGSILGAGKGVIFAVIFCAVISSIVVFTKSGFLIFTRESIEASTLFELLCKINPIY